MLAYGVLKWAVGNTDIDELRQKFQKIEYWLNETQYPTFNQLQNLALYLDFLFGYFFLSSPLKQEEANNIDFRTIKNKIKSDISKDLRHNIVGKIYKAR